MADGHDHHAGPPSVDTDRRALTIALVLLVAFMAFEVGAAVASNSLVLLADAGHMLVDVGAIAGSWWPSGWRHAPRRGRTPTA